MRYKYIRNPKHKPEEVKDGTDGSRNIRQQSGQAEKEDVQTGGQQSNEAKNG